MEVQGQMHKPLRELIEIMHFTENVSTSIRGLLDEAQICRTVKDEFLRSTRYTMSIALLTDDGSKLRIAATSLPPEQLQALQALDGTIGIRPDQYQIDLNESSVFQGVVRQGRTVHLSHRGARGQLLPRPLADLVTGAMAPDQTQSILTPLSHNGEPIGAFAMSSADLAEYLIPSVRNLAQHISTALGLVAENVKRERAEETLRKAEQALRDSQEAFRALLDATTESAFLIDAQAVVFATNETAAQRLGTTAEKLVGSCLYDLLPPGVREARKARLNEVIRTKQPVHFQDGRAGRTFDHHICPILDAKGEVTRVAIFVADITAQNQTMEALRASQERFQRMAEAIPAVFWMMSPDWKQPIYVSPAFEKVYGHTCESFYRRPGLWLDAIHPYDRKWVLAFWAKHHAEQTELEYRILRPDREVRWVRNVASPLRNEAGEPGLLVGFVEDITERKRMEAHLTQSEKLASVGVLAGGVAHELRNPLGIISANSQLLLEHPDDAQLGSQCAQKIHTATQRASQIIENLLVFSRPATVHMAETDVQPVLEQTLALLAEQMASRRVTLRKDSQPNLPRVRGNPTLLQQVFTNLVLNACNAMPRGGILTVIARTTEAGWVEMQFRDTGRGIRPEHLSRVFEPFFTTMPAGKGIGLGLSTSYSIIQQHRGTIDVQSQVRRGTTFTVRLPGIASVRRGASR